jgi:xanthine/uracil permease
MQITHEEAHRLIQFDTDHALRSNEKRDLVAHLEACEECKFYVESIQEIGSVLRPFLQRNWNKQPIPLSVATVTGKRNQALSQRAFMATRIAVIGVICISFVFSVWQFAVSSHSTPQMSLLTVPPMPTPSTRTVSMTSTSSNCVGIPYLVKEKDSLGSIAEHFAVSEEDILTTNRLTREAFRTGVEIIVPACTSTPTGTVNAETTTYTPSSGPITSTPGG